MLLAEADARRITLVSDLRRITAPFARFEQLSARSRPFILLGAPIVGFLLTRRFPGLVRWGLRGAGVASLVRKLLRNPSSLLSSRV